MAFWQPEFLGCATSVDCNVQLIEWLVVVVLGEFEGEKCNRLWWQTRVEFYIYSVARVRDG